MIDNVIREAAETLNENGEICLCLELLEQAISHNLIDINDVVELIQEIALDNDCQHLEQALEILEANGIEIPREVKNRRFTIEINDRLIDVLKLIRDLDRTKLGQSRVNSVIFDLSEYLNEISDN